MKFIVPRSCRRCHDRRAELKDGILRCFRCGKPHGELSQQTISFVGAVAKQFGGVDSVILHDKRNDAGQRRT
jgi:hypothetical protein